MRVLNNSGIIFKMKSRKGVATALSVGLFASQLMPKADTEHQITLPISAKTIEQNAIDVAYSDIRRDWTAQKVGLTATHVVMLASNESPTCSSPPVQHIDLDIVISPVYCMNYNTVYMSPSMEDYVISKGLNPDATTKVILAHEMGHAVQDQTKQDIGRLPEKYTELQADCYAGAEMERLYPAEVVPGSRFYDSLRDMDDPDHGTVDERLHYYFQGVLTGHCQMP